MSNHILTEQVGEELIHYPVPEDEWHFHDHDVPRLVAPHLDGPLPLRLAPFRPITRHEQQLGVTHMGLSPFANLDFIWKLGYEIVGKERVDEFVEAYRDRADLSAARQMDMRQGLRSGMITNHGMLHDVAVIPALELLAWGHEEYIPRSAIVMSKAITRLEVETQQFGTMAATDALSVTGNSYFSIPRTRSTFMANISSDMADETNRLMYADLQKWLERGGVRLALAPSGTTDKVEDDGIHMHRMSTRTAELIAGLDRVLLVAVNLGAVAGRPWFKIIEYTDEAHGNPKAAHRLMEKVAEGLEGITEQPVQYEQERFYEKEGFTHARESVTSAAHRAGESARRAAERVKGRVLLEFEERRTRKRAAIEAKRKEVENK